MVRSDSVRTAMTIVGTGVRVNWQGQFSIVSPEFSPEFFGTSPIKGGYSVSLLQLKNWNVL